MWRGNHSMRSPSIPADPDSDIYVLRKVGMQPHPSCWSISPSTGAAARSGDGGSS